MRNKAFGKTGRTVSTIGFGALPLSIQGRPNEQDSIRVLHAALDEGMTFIDTADCYCLNETEIGHGERLVARAVRQWKGPRGDILVFTKGGLTRREGAWKPDGRPEHLRNACDHSLRALGVSSIFLYQLHRPDPNVYFPDSVGALADLRQEGKIQHVGLSNVDVAHLRDACRVTEIASVQNRCNVFDRHPFANGMITACERAGIAFIAHSPVGGHSTHDRVADHPTLRAVGARRGLTPHQVALAWLLAQSPVIFPIAGASKTGNAMSSAAAADIVLSPEDGRALRAAFPPTPLAVQQLVAARREARHVVRTLRALSVGVLRRRNAR